MRCNMQARTLLFSFMVALAMAALSVAFPPKAYAQSTAATAVFVQGCPCVKQLRTANGAPGFGNFGSLELMITSNAFCTGTAQGSPVICTYGSTSCDRDWEYSEAQLLDLAKEFEEHLLAQELVAIEVVPSSPGIGRRIEFRHLKCPK